MRFTSSVTCLYESEVNFHPSIFQIDGQRSYQWGQVQFWLRFCSRMKTMSLLVSGCRIILFACEQNDTSNSLKNAQWQFKKVTIIQYYRCHTFEKLEAGVLTQYCKRKWPNYFCLPLSSAVFFLNLHNKSCNVGWDSWLFNLVWSLLFMCWVLFSGHNLHTRGWGDMKTKGRSVHVHSVF